MSIGYKRDDLEPETVQDIEAKVASRQHGKSERLRWSCGCYEWNQREISLCDYHQGFDYGVEIGKAAKPMSTYLHMDLNPCDTTERIGRVLDGTFITGRHKGHRGGFGPCHAPVGDGPCQCSLDEGHNGEHWCYWCETYWVAKP